MEIAALAEVRMARQAVLTRPGSPLEFWAIIHEAALHRRFAVRPTAMREQLRKLLEAAEMPNVTIQVMPLDSTAHPGLQGGFSLVTFPGSTPDVVLLENRSGAAYVEGDDASTLCRRGRAHPRGGPVGGGFTRTNCENGRRGPQVNGLKAELYSYNLSAATWRKPSASGSENNCVQITDLPGGGIAVRDSKKPDREPLCFDAAEWAALRHAFLTGEF
ncbi:Scr1 family TA system antitoxin-like transcriptional regulator [Streptomyces sp. NPDC001858]